MKIKGIKIAKQYCPQNHICPTKSICPVGAIEQKGFSAPTINKEKCILCGKCLKTCPVFRPIK